MRTKRGKRERGRERNRERERERQTVRPRYLCIHVILMYIFYINIRVYIYYL